MSEKLIDPTLWAQNGGLLGLVIFALFVALAIFLWAQLKIYELHRSDLKYIMDMHSREREHWGQIIDAGQRENIAAIKGMTSAISDLANRHQRFTDKNA